MVSSDGQSVFYYNPATQDFQDLCNDLQIAHSRKFRKKIDKFYIDSIHVIFLHPVRQPDASLQWLDAYQREDLLEIDRSIADGSVTLKKRESKLREELQMRESEYICFDEFRYASKSREECFMLMECLVVRIYTATWNVNGQPPSDVVLRSWLANCSEPPDIYAVAFQELDLSPKAITFSESRPDPVWM